MMRPFTPTNRPPGFLLPLIALTLATLAESALPHRLQAQQGCQWEIVNRDRGYTHSVQGPGGQFIHHVSGGIDYRCPDGARILADSAAIFQADNLAQLFGNVRFTDPDTELLSRRAFYYSNTRRLNAWENIRLFDRENGAIITGDELVLDRASPVRPMDRMVITGTAPHAAVFLSEGGIERVVPYEVDAQRFTLEGRRFFRAGGGVVVDRATLHAVGDSLDFDQSLGVMSVFGNARVQDANFDLTARTVTVMTPEGLVEEVLARENAELEGDGVFLEAPSIRMFVKQNLVERLVALRRILPIPDSAAAPVEAEEEEEEGAPVDEVADTLPRPSAIAESFHLWADSIEVRSPGQVLDRVIAVGTARGESITAADSVVQADLPDIAQEDWMEGDTIVVVFLPPDSLDPATPADTAESRVELESISAMGSARSLYKVPASDSLQAGPDARRALHYVKADVIRIQLTAGEVERMEVEGQTTGFHFEPVLRAQRDTVPVPPMAPRAARKPRWDDRLECCLEGTGATEGDAVAPGGGPSRESTGPRSPVPP